MVTDVSSNSSMQKIEIKTKNSSHVSDIDTLLQHEENWPKMTQSHIINSSQLVGFYDNSSDSTYWQVNIQHLNRK